MLYIIVDHKPALAYIIVIFQTLFAKYCLNIFIVYTLHEFKNIIQFLAILTFRNF